MRICLIWFARPSVATAVVVTTPSPRASVNPGAPPANERAADAPASTPRPRLREGVSRLLARVADVPLDDATRAHLRAQVTDAVAQRRGRALRADALLQDVLDDLPALVDAVLAGRVPGFTAASLRYAIELAAELAARHEARLQHDRARATAASQKQLSVAEVLACRTELVRRTGDVLAGDAPERAALAKGARLSSRTLDAALGAVEAALGVAGAVLARGAADADFGRYLDAMGYTRGAVDALVAPAQPALDVRASHRAAFTAGGVAQQEVDLLEGRLYAQLLRLRERAAAARAAGVALPTVRAARVLRRHAAKKAGPTPTPAGAPVQPRAAKRAKKAKSPVAAEPTPPTPAVSPATPAVEPAHEPATG